MGEEWRSSQLVSSTLLPKNKESATDKVFATDKGSTREEVSAATNKVLASDEILATKKQRQRSTATFSFRGFMGNYRLRLLHGSGDYGTVEMLLDDDLDLHCTLGQDQLLVC